jgi:hypothetical protein
MAEGTSAVATRYGGNLDFMDDSNSRLVDFTLQQVGEGSAPYPSDSFWAEPDLVQAATLMQEAVEQASANPGSPTRKSLISRSRISDNTISFFDENLTRIWGETKKYRPQAVMLCPAEGFSKPEGQHANPVWWQVQPTSWLSFEPVSNQPTPAGLVATFTLKNVPSKRPCEVAITFRDEQKRFLLQAPDETWEINIPIRGLAPHDEIRIDCFTEPWQTRGDHRSFYLQVGKTKVEVATSNVAQITARKVTENPSMKAKIKKLFRP